MSEPLTETLRASAGSRYAGKWPLSTGQEMPD